MTCAITLLHSSFANALQPPLTDAARDGIGACVAEEWSHDDNLFRLPPTLTGLQAPDGSELNRSDDLISTSVCAKAAMRISRQTLVFGATVAANRFHHNAFLDNNSGAASLLWNWGVGADTNGRIGGAYDRALANFASTRLPIKDMVDTAAYFAELRRGIHAHWFLFAGARHTETTHGAVERRLDNAELEHWNAGIEYVPTAETLVGVEYRRTNADFPDSATALASSARSFDHYRENAGYLHLKHALGKKTALEASGGFLQREYPSAFDDFEGGIWRATMTWETTSRIEMSFSAWHELSAYADAESDYFISRGLAFSPAWEISDRVRLTLQVRKETQRYLASTPSQGATDSVAPRDDRVRYATLSLQYAPRNNLEFSLAARKEERASNRYLFDYDDTLIAASGRLKVGR